MQIAIFGATGGVGHHLIDQALNEGHDVTVLTRSPKKLGDHKNRIRIIKGDVKNADAVARAVEGQEAVICALGAPLRDTSGIRTKGTKKIIAAMKSAEVERLVCLSSAGVGDSHAILPLHYRALIVPMLMGRVFKDHNGQEAAVMQSGLDWTLVRPGNYTDGPQTGAYQHGLTEEARRKRPNFKISRADVADFILTQLDDPAYMHQAAWLSY